MRNIVGPAIGGEQECRDGRRGCIVAGRDEELEEVEEAQRGDEKGDAPEGGRAQGAQQERQAQRDAQAGPKQERADGNSRERSLAGGEIRGVEGCGVTRRTRTRRRECVARVRVRGVKLTRQPFGFMRTPATFNGILEITRGLQCARGHRGHFQGVEEEVRRSGPRAQVEVFKCRSFIVWRTIEMVNIVLSPPRLTGDYDGKIDFSETQEYDLE